MTTKNDIITILKTNPKAIARALIVLNERQTDSEKSHGSTIVSNGQGFTSADARMGTSMANFYIKNGFLTSKQIQYWLVPNSKGVERIVKYANQLLDISKQKQQKC